MVKIIPLAALVVAGSGLALNAESIKEERVNQDYSFTVPSYQKNVYSKAYYRGDSDAKWGASLESNTEGVGTIMQYSIYKSGGAKISNWHDIKQGSGFHEYSDVKNFRGDVKLAVQNNNNSSKFNSISGEWDEE